ncbi:MAG: YbaB/EbfC family nucleoid-associated protein [Dehalococcoidia bacterium]|nr:YbaB/EbfC family nucleoid-associated protein [Dehalococcoidia bacterium]
MDLSMMKQALEMRSKLEKAQKELAKKTIDVEQGKGAVKVTVNGHLRITALKIDPAAVNLNKIGDLEKLIFKAVNEAIDKAQDMASKDLKEVTGGLKIPGLT